jgi:hypothetical protein
MYGPTETTIWSLVHELDDVPDGPIPIGRPIANTTVHVLDHLGRQLPIGVFGELHIGGDGVARGYHDRPELTAQRFVERPGLGRTYATGDVARVHADGYVEFGGRADNQVKIRGHRIELGEIETVLERHPAIGQAVVVARGESTDPVLVAFVVPASGERLDVDDVRRHVATALPSPMWPVTYVAIEAVPLTPNGKVDRKALPDASVSSAPVETAERPSTGTEEMVAAIWASELGRPAGRHDNFFDLGGHSLMAVKVFRRVADETAAPVSLTDVFRYPTVAAFAAHLERVRDGGPASESPSAGTDRGALRRQALARRGGPE